MAIKRLVWDPGANRDVHLLRGATSRELISTGLRVVDETGSAPDAPNYLLLTPGDRIVFTPQFKRTSAPGADYENNELGFRVDQRTGAVTASVQHTRIKHNFVIEIQGVNQDGSVSSNIETIRVHVHDSVTDAWLTPDPLTIRPTSSARPDLNLIRFTLRVQFDTGVVGDLTTLHDARWSSTGPSGADANVGVTGVMELRDADVTGGEFQVTATLPPGLSGRATAPATVRIGESWGSDPAPPKAKIVVGGAWPGTILPDRVPNILVFGDGFRAEDGPDFDAIVDKLVHHIKTDRTLRPYDLLSTSMNFWKVFQPSRTLGISIRSEVYTFEAQGRTVAATFPILERPATSGKWSLAQLLYAAGLPVPFDATRPNDLIKADWDAVLETASWPSNVPGLIDDWKKLANRGFVEELDAFPGMSYGAPPAADAAGNIFLDLHEDRGGTRALKPFYAALKAENDVTTEAGKPVGDLWATRDLTVYDFDNTDLVLLISAVNAGRAVNGTGYIAMSRKTAEMSFAVLPLGGGRIGWRLDLHDPPKGISTENCRTAAHELGHSFGLGDEYVEFPEPFPRNEASLETYANLQTEADARDTAGRLRGDLIKWKWHRIRKAGVLDGDITVEDGAFRIPLVLGHATPFEEGDEVLLRARTKGVPLKRGQTTLANGKVLRVVEALTDADILVRPVDAALSFNDLTQEIQRDYKRGSIVYVPTRAPDSARSATYPYAEMVAKNIQDSISSRNRPLTASPCVFDKREVQKPDLTGVDLPGILCFKFKTQIVGLYSGGDRHPCGIFHPAGLCVMRNHKDADTEFCAVCKYILVDFINPFRHFEIDRDYAEIYPQE